MGKISPVLLKLLGGGSAGVITLYIICRYAPLMISHIRNTHWQGFFTHSLSLIEYLHLKHTPSHTYTLRHVHITQEGILHFCFSVFHTHPHRKRPYIVFTYIFSQAHKHTQGGVSHTLMFSIQQRV